MPPITRRAASAQLAVSGLLFSASAVSAPTGPSVRITVEVPPGTGRVYISGNLPALGPWKPDALALEGAGTTRSIELSVPRGTALEYKFTLGSWDREALGPSGMVMPNYTLAAGQTEATHTITDFKKDALLYLRDPSGSGIQGRLVVWENVKSPLLAHPRHITVWLPAEYDTKPQQRFSVVYAHDGQNLLDPRIANTGTDWGVDESIVRLRASGRITPHIVVGIWSTPDRRLEYAPSAVIARLQSEVRADVEREFNGAVRGDAYLSFIANELKPRVDAQFRTLSEAQHTTLMGSSMGGLISLYGLTQMPQVFGRAACLSVHWPVSISRERIFVGASTWQPIITEAWTAQLRELPASTPATQRLWVDRGGVELDSLYQPYMRELVPVFEQAGYRAPNFAHRVYPNATHNEAAWRARLDEVLGHVLS